MIYGTIELMERGMQCLTKELGDIGTEQFIATINREKFNYTEWQRDFFNDVNAEEFNSAAVEYERKNPFKKGNENY